MAYASDIDVLLVDGKVTKLRNKLKAQYVQYTVTASSTLNDVSASFAAKTPGGTSAQAGVITTAPYNFCDMIDASTRDRIDDGFGNSVYARLTEASSTWTLTYYSNIAGTETPYTFAVPQVILYVSIEVFKWKNIPAISGEMGTLIADATAVLGPQSIKDFHIDWGSGANQVDASDMPFTASSTLSSTIVSDALDELDVKIVSLSSTVSGWQYTPADFILGAGATQTIDYSAAFTSTNPSVTILKSIGGVWMNAINVVDWTYGFVMPNSIDVTNVGGVPITIRVTIRK